MRLEKFIIFLHSLETKENLNLLESVKSGFMICMEGINKISLQKAQNEEMFGPVYHGTDGMSREKIEEEGFKVFIGNNEEGHIKHGYPDSSYGGTGIPPPIHHLGYGIYLTTTKAIAKRFNGDSSKGLKQYFINTKNIQTINFGSPNTMMKWWISNGYDPELAKIDRIEATKRLTDNLKSKCDAVWYKGKGLYKLLDGDQICVFNPDLIVEVDNNLTQKGETSAKVRRKSDGMVGIIKDKRDANKLREHVPGSATWLNPDTNWIMTITWKKGGTDNNVQDVDIDLL